MPTSSPPDAESGHAGRRSGRLGARQARRAVRRAGIRQAREVTVRFVAAERVPLLWTGLGALALPGAWVALYPALRALVDPGKAIVSADLAFAAAAVLAGVVTGLALALRPGRAPAGRLAVVLVAALLGAALAWGIGRLLGAPPVRATGVLLLWPLVAALLVTLKTVAEIVMHGD